MSERTPNTATVRHGWIKGHPFPLFTDIDDRGAEFDRWLSERDRQVAERAWDEGWDASERYGYPIDEDDSYENPYRAAKGEQKLLDPKPWLFISDQVFGEFRSDHDEGYNSVSGTHWAFSPRPTYSQDREDYAS